MRIEHDVNKELVFKRNESDDSNDNDKRSE